jgi:predicted negative regulator of RcsB-dependent stress response
MSEPIYLLSISLMLLTILLVFGMRYFSAIQQAKARAASEEGYRKVAESAAAAQAETRAALASIEASLAEATSRLAAIEKVLKDVG